MRKPLSMITMVMGALALMASVFISTVGATPPDNTTTTVEDEAKKVFVCKYVGKPGVDEVLQSGNNPISVSVNSIKDYAGVGSYFNDAQGRSFVLAEDTRTGGGQEGEPSVSQCPVPSTTTTTEAPTTTTTEQPTTTTQVEETTTTTQVEETTTTTEQPTTTTTEPVVETTVPETTTTTEATTTTQPEVDVSIVTVPTVPPTTDTPVTVLPTVPTTPDTAARVAVTPRPAVQGSQLARTGASDTVPALTLLGVGLLTLGVILSRKSATV